MATCAPAGRQRASPYERISQAGRSTDVNRECELDAITGAMKDVMRDMKTDNAFISSEMSPAILESLLSLSKGSSLPVCSDLVTPANVVSLAPKDDDDLKMPSMHPQDNYVRRRRVSYEALVRTANLGPWERNSNGCKGAGTGEGEHTIVLPSGNINITTPNTSTAFHEPKSSKRRKKSRGGAPNDALWRTKYDMLRNYLNEHGEYPSYHSGSLGKWVDRQRRAYKGTGDRPANFEQRAKLLELLPEWTWDDSSKFGGSKPNDVRWMANYDVLKARMEKKNAVFPTTRDPEIGKWIDTNRQAYRKKGRAGMDPVRVFLLEEVPGWLWEDKRYSHMSAFGRHGSS